MTPAPTKTAIVTGGSRGIGRAVALRLARDGFAVVVNFAGNTAKAEEAIAEIKALGGRAIAVRADVAHPADVDNLFDETERTFGSVDVVVHSAGVMKMLPLTTSS